MTWQYDVRKCIDVIATSYEYIPLIAKLCFLYFAAFPEGTEIEAKDLLRIWTGDGLIRIRPNDRRTLEEIAECIIEDLAQRNMVQVLKRSFDGSIMSIRVHDVVRELAVRKAQEFNFLVVCSKPDDWKHCNMALAPRVAIHYSSDLNVQISNYASPDVYSLLIFSESKALKVDCSKFRMLRVLGCMGFGTVVNLESYKGAPHLRYLQLAAHMRGEEGECEEWIKSMKYLETLNLRESNLGCLSDSIWQAKTQLRHTLLDEAPYFTLFNPPTKGPPASVDLKNLQTLRAVTWNDSWETSCFPNIPNVRELHIYIPREIPSREVASLIDRLQHLIHLDISGHAIDLQEIATATKGCPFNENLESLYVTKFNDSWSDGGTLPLPVPLVLRDDMLPRHLIELRISGYEFGSDFMSVLEKLGSLKALTLWGTSSQKNENRVRRIKCSAGGFKQLEDLNLSSLPLEEWEIEPGAMPMLKRLQVWYCDPLRVPPELTNHLSSLQGLIWWTYIHANSLAIDNILEQQPHLISFS